MTRGPIPRLIALRRLIVAAGLAVALLAGCLPSAPAASTAPPPGDPGATFPPPLGAARTYAMFADGETAAAGGVEGALAVTHAGDLVLPSGRLVANDVFFFGTAPFERLVPAGTHPVELLEIGAESFGRRVAAALLRVGPGDPVEWEMALLPTDDPTTLGPEEYFGFGVDSGTAAFASAEAAELIEARFEELDYVDRVLAGLEPVGDEYPTSVDVVLDSASGLNVIGFSSGWGDGAYPTWFGLDGSDRPVVVLIDFIILDGPAH